jgi:hypothetical protein
MRNIKRVITAPGSNRLSIRRRTLVRTIGMVCGAALVLAYATVDPASAHGGGGGGGGRGGPGPGGGQGGSMMGGFVFGGGSTPSQDAVSCRNNKTAAHCRGGLRGR